MQGNHLLSPQGRLMLGASIFAVVAVGALVLVWLWPTLFGQNGLDAGTPPLTEEQQERIREDLRASLSEQAGPPIEEEAQESIRAELTDQVSTPESEVRNDEAADIRAQLGASAQQ